MKAPSTLTFDKLGCSKGGRELFRNVDYTLSSGQWMYLTGVNGVGKTSLLRMVCGLASIGAGDILWNGQSIHKQADAYHQDLSYLGHLNGLQESMTVAENLTFTTALAGRSITERRIRDVIGRFGLHGRASQLVRHLSQGQKRRVALSRLSLSPARLWVLDEPYVAMDEGGVKMLADLIAEHLQHNGLALVTSHQRVPVGDIPARMLELKAA